MVPQTGAAIEGGEVEAEVGDITFVTEERPNPEMFAVEEEEKVIPNLGAEYDVQIMNVFRKIVYVHVTSISRYERSLGALREAIQLPPEYRVRFNYHPNIE